MTKPAVKTFDGLRARLSTRTWDMAIQKGPSTNMASKADPSTSNRFKLGSWSELRVRSRVRILDIFLNFVLFTPLAVLFQVCATGVQDALFMSYVPPWIGTLMLLSIGIGIEFSCSLWQQRLSGLKVIRESDPDATIYIATTRFYHFAIGFANVCHYRGLSDIYYYCLGYGPYRAIQAITTTVLMLSGLKCARNVLGPPLSLGVDSTIEEFFETSTLFRTKDERYIRHIADNAATVLGVTSLCFLHWLGVWTFFDAIIYPGNATLSVIVSGILGYTICAVILALELRLKQISKTLEKQNKNFKIGFEDAVLLVGNAAVILVWRAHWVFFESFIYYFPIYHNGFDVSAFYGLMSSFAMMCLLHTSSTLIMKGCDFDGDLNEGEGLNFGLEYFADFFREEIEEQDPLEPVSGTDRDGAEDEDTGDKSTINNNSEKQKYLDEQTFIGNDVDADETKKTL